MKCRMSRVFTRPNTDTPWFSSESNPYQKHINQGTVISDVIEESEDGLQQTRIWTFPNSIHPSDIRSIFNGDQNIVDYIRDTREYNDQNGISSSSVLLEIIDESTLETVYSEHLNLM